MSVQAARTRRRNEAILWIHGRMGQATFTTHEMWAEGQSILDEPWPQYMKQSWRRMHRVDLLGLALSSHPAFERVRGGLRDGIVDTYKAGERTRSYTWRLKDGDR